MINRREFSKQAGAFCLWSFTKPDLPFPTLPLSPELKQDKLEKLRTMGVDGKTVWEARGLPLYLKHLTSGENRYEVVLNGVDLQVDYPFLGEPQLLPVSRRSLLSFRIPEIKGEKIFAEIPTSTGTFARYIVDLGYFVAENPVIKADKPYQEGKTLACYFHCERYYDNKIVNASLAVLRIAKTMLEKPILPGETFSFLKAAQINSLIENKEVLDGWGLRSDANGETKKAIMYGGGICCSVSTLVKMACQAELRNGSLKIDEFHPHSKEKFWYFINPSDPDSFHQKDATAYSPDKDLKFTNQTTESLYIIPKVQIIPWREQPNGYDPLNDSTAVLVMSFTLTDQPITAEKVLAIEKELNTFRNLRKI